MIYLHVPFCRSFCTYCGFYSETVPCRKGGGEPLFDAYAERVCREIEDRLPDFVATNGLPVNTLYIGGGTPSVLPLATLRRIVSHLRRVLSNSGTAVDPVVTENVGICSAGVNCRPATLVVSKKEGICSSGGGCPTFEEFTVEVNPEDVVEKGAGYVQALLEMGVNRISMGVQSFDDGILRWMNRRHDAARAREAVRILREAGVRNVSIDLIFGLSQLSDAQWEATLDQALALEPEATPRLQKKLVGGSMTACANGWPGPVSTITRSPISPVPDSRPCTTAPIGGASPTSAWAPARIRLMPGTRRKGSISGSGTVVSLSTGKRPDRRRSPRNSGRKRP